MVNLSGTQDHLQAQVRAHRRQLQGIQGLPFAFNGVVRARRKDLMSHALTQSITVGRGFCWCVGRSGTEVDLQVQVSARRGCLMGAQGGAAGRSCAPRAAVPRSVRVLPQVNKAVVSGSPPRDRSGTEVNHQGQV